MKRTAVVLIPVALALSVLTGSPAQAKVTVVSIRTDFGYVNVAEVKAPKAGKCVRIPIVIDVRNPDFIQPVPVTVGLFDDFTNIAAFAAWVPPDEDELTRGKYRITMRACRKPHLFTAPDGSTEAIEPYDRKVNYTAAVVHDREAWGPVDYYFRTN